MKVATRKPGILTYRGRIYVVGGMGKEKDLNFVQIFNPVTEEWEDNDITAIKENKDNNMASNAKDVLVPPLEELCGKERIYLFKMKYFNFFFFLNYCAALNLC